MLASGAAHHYKLSRMNGEQLLPQPTVLIVADDADAGAQGVMVAGNWWWITFPGLAVVATVLSINFIGDGLRDALDPKIIR